jgi:hypothetical protein
MSAADAHQQLSALAGRRATVDVAALPASLHLVHMSPGRIGAGSCSHTGQHVTLRPDMPVVVRQRRAKVATVREYIDLLASGEQPHPVAVTDRPQDGRLWHINGLHRLLAARLLGVTIQASVWR